MLKLRVITALLLAALLLAALFWLPAMAWSLFLLAFIMVGAWEWCGLAAFGSAARYAFLSVTLLCALLLLPGIAGLEMVRAWGVLVLLAAACVFWLAVVPLWLHRRWRISRPWPLALTGILLLLPPWVALVDLRQVGPFVVLAVMGTVWLADSAAYFAGKRYGKHKLAPEISPGKTWEGVMGALLAVAVAGIALCLQRSLSLWFVPGFLALAVLSVMGDLFESWIKRLAGKKDSGSLLPGHGGVLDRIDGLTPSLPLAVFALYLPLYVGLLTR